MQMFKKQSCYITKYLSNVEKCINVFQISSYTFAGFRLHSIIS